MSRMDVASEASTVLGLSRVLKPRSIMRPSAKIQPKTRSKMTREPNETFSLHPAHSCAPPEFGRLIVVDAEPADIGV